MTGPMPQNHATITCLVCGKSTPSPDCFLGHRHPMERPNYLSVWLVAGLLILGTIALVALPFILDAALSYLHAFLG